MQKIFSHVFLNSTANIISEKLDLSIRIKKDYNRVLTNYFNHSSILPVKEKFKNVYFLKNFGDKVQDLI